MTDIVVTLNVRVEISEDDEFNWEILQNYLKTSHQTIEEWSEDASSVLDCIVPNLDQLDGNFEVNDVDIYDIEEMKE